MTVEFRVLNGEPVDLGHARQRSVLAVLLVEADYPVQTGLRVGQARAYDVIGRAHNDLGEVEAARYHWNQALTMYSTLGIPEAEQMRQLLETS